MRVEFVNAVDAVLKNNKSSIFLTGDLGYNAFEKLQEKYGSRFINAGAAEQNMVGVAAGLALQGFTPWIYSIAPFVTYRPFEQVRNDVCLHNLPVKIVGNGGGYTYGIMGATHHTLEDIGVFKTLPNMTIFLPCTNNHVQNCVDQMAALSGPSYLRLGFPGFQANIEPLSQNNTTLTRRYSKGEKHTIIGVGQATQIALKAMQDGLFKGDDISVFGIAKYPFDLTADHELIANIDRTQSVIMVEEHYLAGSLTESLRMQLPQIKKFTAMTSFYSKDHKYGSPAFQANQAQLTPTRLKELIS